MSSFEVPGVEEVAGMSPAELEAFVRGLDRVRRQVEGAIATFVHRVDESGAYRTDKHRTPKAWGKAACNWSGGEAARFVRAGNVLDTFSTAAAACAEGQLGVAQLHALGRVCANARVKDTLAEGEALLVGSAATLDYDDYVTVLAQWEKAADPDGAHQSHERAFRNRRASASIVGQQFLLDAQGGVAAGIQMKAILDAFAKSEWIADWEEGVVTHGSEMCAGLMARTDAQRRFDALLAIFLRAASMEGDSTGSAFTVNLHVGLDVFEQHLAATMGGEPPAHDARQPEASARATRASPSIPTT